jgi:hypothetical protein
MIRLLLFFFTICTLANGQQLIEGKVIDSETRKPLPFVSIGIVGTSQGTSSNLNGEFSLAIKGTVTLKITSIGYESRTISTNVDYLLIELKPVATKLNEIFVYGKSVNPRRVVRKAFANIKNNYDDKGFLQNFFYRHYCKDNSDYGRLIEASVNVWKHNGYQSTRKAAGNREEIRINQLRRSLDKTAFSQGHEPISIHNILQADIVGYQVTEKSPHVQFYSEVNNLRVDFDNYLFEFDGITMLDGQTVYKISYSHKRDSVLTTTGYMPLPHAEGSLFITMDSFAFVQVEEVKSSDRNTIRTTAYYRKFDDKYYPYHLVREGESYLVNDNTHAFHIELVSVDLEHDAKYAFVGSEIGKDELLQIAYDSAYWKNNTILKTTPLENEIIRDLGAGLSLQEQFKLYRLHEFNRANGDIDAENKLKWILDYSHGKNPVYLAFWSGKLESYVTELEYFKRLNTVFRGKILFVLISIDVDVAQWKLLLTKFNLFADGIVNYRLEKDSGITKQFEVTELPAFVLLSKTGEVIDLESNRPSSAAIAKDLKRLIEEHP